MNLSFKRIDRYTKQDTDSNTLWNQHINKQQI